MLLGISTSQSNISIVFGKNHEVNYYDEHAILPNSGTDIGNLFQKAINFLKIDVSEIEKIIVDIGPGGTSSVRTGVAFANGLAFSLKIPILPISSMKFIGLDVFEKLDLPVLVIFPSVKQNFYYGIYEKNEVSMKYGQLDEIVRIVEENHKKIALAGYGKALNILPNFIKKTEVIVSGIQKVDAKLMITHLEKLNGEFQFYPNLPVPITELEII